jgi:hypothetical protein
LSNVAVTSRPFQAPIFHLYANTDPWTRFQHLKLPTTQEILHFCCRTISTQNEGHAYDSRRFRIVLVTRKEVQSTFELIRWWYHDPSMQIWDSDDVVSMEREVFRLQYHHLPCDLEIGWSWQFVPCLEWQLIPLFSRVGTREPFTIILPIKSMFCNTIKRRWGQRGQMRETHCFDVMTLLMSRESDRWFLVAIADRRLSGVKSITASLRLAVGSESGSWRWQRQELNHTQISSRLSLMHNLLSLVLPR